MGIKIGCGHLGPNANSAFLEAPGGCGYGAVGEWEIEGPADLECPKCHNRVDAGSLAMIWEAWMESKDLIQEIGGRGIFSLSKKTVEPFFTLTDAELADDEETEEDL